MKKKILLALATLALSLPASAYDCEVDGIAYNLSGSEATVTSKIISISPVTSRIILYAGTVTIPESITYNDIPYRVTYIGVSAFSGCTGLTAITIPESITSIGSSAFYGCTGLTAITIPESVTRIGSYAFRGCTGLTAITIPESVTDIGESAFSGCTGLTAITIPESVTSIGSHAFSGCTGLTAITINSNSVLSKHYSSSSSLKDVFGTQVREYVLGDKIESIGNYAFSGCTGLTAITIPESVTRIGSYAFRGCTGLTAITIPESVTRIGSYAFDECGKLCANPGSVACLALWNANYSVYNKATDSYINRPYLSLNNRTQTTLSLTIKNYNAKYSYGLKYSSSEFEGNQLDVKGLRPEQSYSFDLMVCLDGVEYNPSEVNFTTLSISPSVKSSQTTASSVQLSGSYIKGDAEVVSQTIQMAGISQEGNEMVVTGLEPGRSYNTTYTIKVKDGTSTYDYTGTATFTTEDLVLKSLNPKNVKVGEAVVCAETNVSDRETNVGFEWRKIDAPETVPSKQGTAVIYDGVMEGYIKNLQTTSYYNVRPYYQSAAGNIYYGEWIGIDPADYSYFAPTVHTYAYVEMVDGVPVLSGYVMDGSDDIVERGFEFWLSGSGVKLRVKAEAPADVHTVVASGQKMTATLSGLRSNTTYTCRAYAKTNSETFYGEEITFTTPVATGIEEVQDAEFSAQGNNTVYDVQGRLVGDTLEGLPRGIYIMDGRKYWVK